MEFTAKLRFARLAPRKMRYVADLIRGANINRALETLKVVPNRGSYYLNKLLRSAIANASNRDENVDVDTLTIKSLRVDPGPALKRIRYGPMGRVLPIRKETCHVHVILEPEPEQEEGEKPRKRRSAVDKAKEQIQGGAKPAEGAAKTESKEAKK